MSATATLNATAQALTAAANASDWEAFQAAEMAMWDAYHRGGIKLDPSALPIEIEYAWRESMRILIEDTWKIGDGEGA